MAKEVKLQKRSERDGHAAGTPGLGMQWVTMLLAYAAWHCPDTPCKISALLIKYLCEHIHIQFLRNETTALTHLHHPSHRCRFPVRSWWGGSGTGPGRRELITRWVGPLRWWAAERKLASTHGFVTEEQLISKLLWLCAEQTPLFCLLFSHSNANYRCEESSMVCLQIE